MSHTNNSFNSFVVTLKTLIIRQALSFPVKYATIQLSLKTFPLPFQCLIRTLIFFMLQLDYKTVADSQEPVLHSKRTWPCNLRHPRGVS